MRYRSDGHQSPGQRAGLKLKNQSLFLKRDGEFSWNEVKVKSQDNLDLR